MFDVDDDVLLWRGDGETVRIEPWGRGIRVRASLLADPVDNEFALLRTEGRHGIVLLEGRTATLTVAGSRVVAEETDYEDWSAGFSSTRLRLRFQRGDGTELLSEIDDGGALKLRAREFRPSPARAGVLCARFRSAESEHLTGMGLYQQALMDLKGTTLELSHRNSQSSVPFVVSSEGYGFLWNNPAVGRATFGRNYTEWRAETTEQLDYWFTAGTPAEIADAYAEATGRCPMMPEYGLGFWQCKMRYWNQEQLLEVAREHQRRGIPLDVIVADFFHWPRMGDWRFEDEFWPDPAAMVKELKELGTELMVSVWPQVSPESENFSALRDRNLLVKSSRGIDAQFFFQGEYTRFIDVTNPRAREFLSNTLTENYGRYGIDLFWLDEAEPEFGAYDFEHYHYAAGPAAQVSNLYPLHYAAVIADSRRAQGTDEFVTLIRAAWAGSQRHGSLVWSGDVSSTWQTLRAQLTAGVHMGSAGIPWFTTDIGGFGNARTDDPDFHELLVRWFQFGTFSPVMRLHGDRRPSAPVMNSEGEPRMQTGADNEVWSFGPEVERILIECIELREHLRPYTRRLMREAHEVGAPVMRGLFYEFPEDDSAWTATDSYLFGPDILVAPVVHPGASTRQLYLPGDMTWTDVWTGRAYAGGQVITVEAPLCRIPLFIRSAETLALLADHTGIRR